MNNYLAWAGSGDCDNIAGVSSGYANDVGHRILFLDYFGSGTGIVVEVAAGGVTRVHNSNANAHFGEIALI